MYIKALCCKSYYHDSRIQWSMSLECILCFSAYEKTASAVISQSDNSAGQVLCRRGVKHGLCEIMKLKGSKHLRCRSVEECQRYLGQSTKSMNNNEVLELAEEQRACMTILRYQKMVGTCVTPQPISSSSGSSRTYRLTWHKLNTIASRTRYTNYREKKIKLMGRIW